MLNRLIRLAVVLTLAPGVIFAVPVLWNLSGVTFAGGGTATGSFVYDAGTNVYSAVNITSSGGSFPTSVYVAPHPAAGPSLIAFVTAASGNLTSTRVIVFAPAGTLSNAGGTLTLSPILTEGVCNDAACSSATGDRTLATGSIIGTASPTVTVPTLSTSMMGLLILLTAGTALAVIRRNEAASDF